MSKKTEFPVMSPAISGILYVVSILLITLRTFARVIITDMSAIILFNGLLGFLAVFLIVWAFMSMVLHPAVDSNLKTLLFFATLVILVYTMANTFGVSLTIGKL